MSGNVIKFPKTQETPDEALEDAKGKYQDVIILGWCKETGFLRYDFSGDLTQAEVNWLLDVFKYGVILPPPSD